MKRKKIFAAVIVVFVLFVFTSLAYSDDPNYGKPFRRLEERIGQNELDITELNEQINELQAQINALQGPQAILVGGEGSFYYYGTPGIDYYFDKAVIVPVGEEETVPGSYTFSLIIASEDVELDAILDDPMGGYPQGEGDALWISIYSSSETKLEPGSYSYQESGEDGEEWTNPEYGNPFTFDDLMLITGFDEDTEELWKQQTVGNKLIICY